MANERSVSSTKQQRITHINYNQNIRKNLLCKLKNDQRATNMQRINRERERKKCNQNRQRTLHSVFMESITTLQCLDNKFIVFQNGRTFSVKTED